MFTQSRAYRLIPVGLIIYNFIANLSNDIYLPSLPSLSGYFSTTDAKVVLTMSAWFLGVAVPQLFWSNLYLRWGARRFVLWGCVIFVLASLACSIAPTIESLITARFFQGVGVSSLNVATFTILHRHFEYGDRLKYQSWVNAVGLIAPLLGPLIGSYIISWFNWRYNFSLIFLSTLPVFLIFYRHLFVTAETSDSHTERRWRNIMQSLLKLTKKSAFMRPCLTYSILMGAVVAYLTNVAFIIVNTFSYPTTFFGWSQIPIFASFIFGTIYSSHKVGEDARHKLLQNSFWLLSSSIILSFAAMAIQKLSLFLATASLFMLAYGLCGSQLIAEAMSHSEHEQSNAAALLSFAMAVFSLLGSLNEALLPFSVYHNTLIFIIGLIGLALLTYYNRKWQHLLGARQERKK